MFTASLRPFGRDRDLDVPFEGLGRPFLVTALLAQCSERTDADAWWPQPVGVRIAALLRLAALSDGSGTLDLVLPCPAEGCTARFEVSLPVEPIAATARAHEPFSIALPDARQVLVRLPTGADQSRWHDATYASAHDAVAAISEALVVDGRIPVEDAAAMTAIEEALAERDPLVHFTLSCVCPTCGAEGDVAVDLEQAALDRLRRVRRLLIEDVHALASAYGWTEREVLAVPAERRAQYRSLIDGVLA